MTLIIVLPALTINYFGQGALILANPKAIENPFFLLYPEWALLPMVLLATAATVIASQAVITGAYSLTQQAIQLGLLPRFNSAHLRSAVRPDLSAAHQYIVADRRAAARSDVPFVKRTRLRLRHRRDRDHGGHRHPRLCGDMEGWSLLAAAAVMGPLLLIDLTFLGAKLLKVVDGGWVPLALGGAIMGVMYTWRRGSQLLFEKTRRDEMPIEGLVKTLENKPPTRVPGTAVFLTSDPTCAPTAMLHSLKHYKVLHEKNVILTVETAHTPRVDMTERVRIEPIGGTFLASSCDLASWSSQTCRRLLPMPAGTAGHSTACRRRSFCPAER